MKNSTSMTGRRFPAARLGLLLGVAASLLMPSTPASAATGWTGADLTVAAFAPNAVNPIIFAYTTTLAGQAPTARVVYETSSGRIEELGNNGGAWWAADLTQATHAPTAAGTPFGYTTTLAGQAPTARVVYRTSSGRIEELGNNGGAWWAADLTQATNAPSANPDGPSAYVTNLTGQGQVARVVYQTSSGRIEELGNNGGAWWAADLTQATYAPSANSGPFGYVTNLTGQGQVARVVYQTSSGRIEELGDSGGAWWAADLTQAANAPTAGGMPFGYTTSLNGQGPVARVVYPTSSGHVEELSDSGPAWSAADLTKITGAPGPATSEPFGYTSSLNGQGPVARVVYLTSGFHIEELSVS
jgi:uncharacterized lipoprotein YmbA